jgi:hypothetical protein
MRFFHAVLMLASMSAAATAAAPLAIIQASVQQSEGGTPVPPGFQHVPGEILFFSFQVDGYQVSPERKVRLSSRIEAVDPKGVPLVPPFDTKVEEELAPQDKEWKPKVRHEIPIPPLAPTGTYHIIASVTDELAKTTVRQELPLEVRGHEVAPSETLVIRNFRFYRDENAIEPLRAAAYRPGDTVWARFDITAYRFGEGNRIDVSYGIAVTAAAGKVLWSQDEAAVEQAESFYPKRYVPGIISLNLDSDIRPGEYGIVVTARDRIGNQTSESTHTFTVE